MNVPVAARPGIFPRGAFTRLAIPIVQPPAGSLKPYPGKGHTQLRGLWK